MCSIDTVSRTPGNVQDPHQIGLERGIIDDAALVAFEDSVIGDVEAHQRDEGADIGFRQPVAEEKAAIREPRLQFVEHAEHVAEGVFIGDLRGREAGAIDAVVEARDKDAR